MTTIIIIIVILIDLCNPLKSMCDFPFVLLSSFDLKAFLLPTGIELQEHVIPDVFWSFFPPDSYGS